MTELSLLAFCRGYILILGYCFSEHIHRFASGSWTCLSMVCPERIRNPDDYETNGSMSDALVFICKRVPVRILELFISLFIARFFGSAEAEVQDWGATLYGLLSPPSFGLGEVPSDSIPDRSNLSSYSVLYCI